MQRTTLVKRVVGVAGDSIEVRDGVLLRNGQRTYEPYVREATRYTLPPTTVPAGCIYVLGDNRNVSDDSHVWGPLAVEQVVGKAFYILWLISRQGFVDEFMQDLVRVHDCDRTLRRPPPAARRPPRFHRHRPSSLAADSSALGACARRRIGHCRDERHSTRFMLHAQEVTGNPALFMERVGEELGRSRMRPR